MSRMDSRWRGNDEGAGAMNRAPTEKPTLVREGNGDEDKRDHQQNSAGRGPAAVSAAR